MRQKAYGFKEQNELGKKGERLLTKTYSDILKPYGPDEADLFCTLNQKLVEVKTDSYLVNETPNFFMEKTSVVHLKKPGGPWQALANKAEIFIYLFYYSKVLFVFNDMPTLVSELEELIVDKRECFVKNYGYYTMGYKIPRDSLESLSHEVPLGKDIMKFLL